MRYNVPICGLPSADKQLEPTESYLNMWGEHMADLVDFIKKIVSDPMQLMLAIGIVVIIIGCIVPIGTSKAERMGKVQVDPKTKKRIFIGYCLDTIGIVICILGFLIFGKR